MESVLPVRRLLGGLLGNNDAQAQRASRSSAGGHNSGTQGSFNNNGSGSQNLGDVNYNSGAYSGNGNTYHRSDYHGGSLIHNSGTTQGNGNGSIVLGGFDSSTRS
ncbi:N66 matrix protein-like [Neltuma alba]|uniref:N66 matrix protein-like n=1 Tax=Neltuma alba TaxID=207710 RepID=UPI0010A4196C|nr:N66 matrix protein-like [Prosopis alba]